MRLRTKLFLTIAAAIACSYLLGCQKLPPPDAPTPATAPFQVDVPYLEKMYREYNEAFFQNKLTKTPKITLDETTAMATTNCSPDGDCDLKFNLKYVAALRVSNIILLHEMCHVKTWNTDFKWMTGIRYNDDHGKNWRTCMLQLDQTGVFRENIIDDYHESVK